MQQSCCSQLYDTALKIIDAAGNYAYESAVRGVLHPIPLYWVRVVEDWLCHAANATQRPRGCDSGRQC